jgi:hypothetical protein
MAGANIFMIYADVSGTNVTLSPRLGTGEQQPHSDNTAEVTLLDGSGIYNDMMVANVLCIASLVPFKIRNANDDKAQIAIAGLEAL